MYNYHLPHLPERTIKPRSGGLTMVMDKGLSVRQVEDLISVASPYMDIVKFGFGTSILSPDLQTKINLYKAAGCRVYLGGTLFEAFIARGMYKEFKEFLKKNELDTVEVSDGSIILDHDKKCEIIADLAKDYTVLSEVGSKEEGILISPGKWISMMKSELEAGSWKVIAEARESGTVGIYRPSGSAHTMLVNKITAKIDKNDILWEAPIKKQQVWFIETMGHNVNLGNIAPEEVIPLETLRLGLRGDTFFNFLPEETSALLKPKVPEAEAADEE